MEEWRPVVGFEDYEVSNQGRVRKGTLYLSITPQTCGYYRVPLRKDGKQYQKLIHRLVAEAFLEPSEKPEVDHIDKNRLNNCVENLRWATRAEQNMNREYPGDDRHIHKHGNRWVVRIWRDKKLAYRESFETLEDARIARDLVID